MLLNLENLFVFDKPEKNLNVKIYPYYQGSKSLKYKFSKLINYKYFHYNKNLQDKINNDLKEELTKKGVKNKKRLGLGETIIYDNPKVYIRQSAKEIIASYDEMPSAANNSLYVFYLCSVFSHMVDFQRLHQILRHLISRPPHQRTPQDTLTPSGRNSACRPSLAPRRTSPAF